MKTIFIITALLSTSVSSAADFTKFKCKFVVVKASQVQIHNLEPMEVGTNGTFHYHYIESGTGVVASATTYAGETKNLNLSIMLKDDVIQAVAPVLENGYVPGLMYTDRRTDSAYSVMCRGEQ